MHKTCNLCKKIAQIKCVLCQKEVKGFWASLSPPFEG